eukprot:1931515-Rhodomonas_salina.1
MVNTAKVEFQMTAQTQSTCGHMTLLPTRHTATAGQAFSKTQPMCALNALQTTTVLETLLSHHVLSTPSPLQGATTLLPALATGATTNPAQTIAPSAQPTR